MAKYQKYAEYQDSGIEWLCEIPSHWFLKKHKYIAEFSKGKNPELLFDNYSDGLYPYLSMDSLRGKADSKYAEYKKGLVLVQDNQPLIIWDGSNSGEFVLGRKGLLSSTMASACLIYEIQDKYYWYLCVCIEPEMRKHATGMGIPHVNGEELRGIVLPLPELNEQTQIANFLDHETSKIDRLIEKQQQLIELLKEKRQAVISHAVTKGLDPNVPMKDSGVEWLGEVPEHWGIWKFAHIAPIITCGVASTPTYVEEDVGMPFLSAQNIKNNKLSLHKFNYIPHSLHEQLTKYRKPELGDILVTRVGAGIGEACIVDIDLEFSIYVSLTHIRVNSNIANNKFVMYFFGTDYCKFLNYEGTVTGGGVGNLNVNNVVKYKIALPSLQEQQKIVEYIEHYVTKQDELILKAESAISLMQERRTALISAAVTGKIDVRHWQAPTVAEAHTELSA